MSGLVTAFIGHVAAASSLEVAAVLAAVASGSERIRAEIPARRGASEEINKYGEQVLRLDAWANQFLCEMLLATGLVRQVYSEELDEPLAGEADAPFVAAIDPLDGSSNLATNNVCGTILSVYRGALARGRDQVAAMCVVYGPLTTVMYTVGRGLHEFVFRPGEGFVLDQQAIWLPQTLGVYGIGGKQAEWHPAFRAFAATLEGRGMKLRYSGTLVADFKQVLHYGGLFAYPLPKLRLTYEARPMAFLMEQAGGASTDGHVSLLDIDGDPDARTPLFLGSTDLIAEITALQTGVYTRKVDVNFS